MAHCIANCRITRECPGGRFTAFVASEWKERERDDSYDEGDQPANRKGRCVGTNPYTRLWTREELCRGTPVIATLRSLLVSCAVVSGCIISASCTGTTDKDQQLRRLEELRARKATETEIIREFGKPFRVAVKGHSSWTELEEFFDRESPSSLQEVRAKLPKYPKVVVYSDESWIKWIFLDDDNVMRDYSLAGQ